MIQMLKFLSLDQLTTSLLQHVLFNCITRRLLCIHASEMENNILTRDNLANLA